MCGPFRKLELFKVKLQLVVPVALTQGPLSRRASTFWTATLSAAVPEKFRAALIVAFEAGEVSVMVGETLSRKDVAAVLNFSSYGANKAWPETVSKAEFVRRT